MEFFALIASINIGLMFIFLLAFAGVIAAVEYESSAGAIAVLVVLFIVLVLANKFLGYDVDPLWLVYNPLTTLMYAAIYFAVGAPYAAVKWWLHLRKNKDEILLRKPESATMEAYVYDYSMRNKDRIMFWMVWWIPSAFWTLTHDLIKGLWDNIYEMFGKTFYNIAMRVLK